MVELHLYGIILVAPDDCKVVAAKKDAEGKVTKTY